MDKDTVKTIRQPKYKVGDQVWVWANRFQQIARGVEVSGGYELVGTFVADWGRFYGYDDHTQEYIMYRLKDVGGSFDEDKLIPAIKPINDVYMLHPDIIAHKKCRIQ